MGTLIKGVFVHGVGQVSFFLFNPFFTTLCVFMGTLFLRLLSRVSYIFFGGLCYNLQIFTLRGNATHRGRVHPHLYTNFSYFNICTTIGLGVCVKTFYTRLFSFQRRVHRGTLTTRTKFGHRRGRRKGFIWVKMGNLSFNTKLGHRHHLTTTFSCFVGHFLRVTFTFCIRDSSIHTNVYGVNGMFGQLKGRGIRVGERVTGNFRHLCGQHTCYSVKRRVPIRGVGIGGLNTFTFLWFTFGVYGVTYGRTK